MSNAHGGYRNYKEWKKADPESYWRYIGNMEIKFEEDTTVKVDENLAAKIANIKIDPNDKFAQAIDRACKGELTPAEMAICETGPKGITAPPLPPKNRYQKVWYVRVWNWIKNLFTKKKTVEDFKSKAVAPQKREIGPNVEINEDFDFQEWVLERHKRIKKAIKEDGKEENTIICPVCYKERMYCIMDNGAIRSTCQGCGINMM